MTLRTFLLAAALAVIPSIASADAVDDAFVRGTEAASRNDWDGATAEFETASALLPQRSAIISYNLGTAYAERGDLGRATYHLRRATDWRSGPTAEVLEAARSNLAAVRRRAELEATTTGSMIDRPQTTWDLLVDAIAAPWVAWFSLICGGLFAGLLFAHRRWLRSQPRRAGASRVVLIALGLIYAIAGVLHGWSIRAASAQPGAIILAASLDARDGPGQHRSVAFTLQGGAEVRLLERSPGWRQVQLPGGVTGWVPEGAVAELDAVRAPGPP
ncbi:MAG: SH3 domain-containing protein [Myxococcota bacterium]